MKPCPAWLLPLFKTCGYDDAKMLLLAKYGEMLEQWQKAINLISPKTLPDMWERHLLDSAQLWPVIRQHQSMSICIDLGSGGGLPGIVLAIAGIQKITLVESDKRKCVFLKEVIRELNLTNCFVNNHRLEAINDLQGTLVTARALAPLSDLLRWGKSFLQPDGLCLFLKGAEVQAEIDVLEVDLKENVTLLPSLTDTSARLLLIQT